MQKKFMTAVLAFVMLMGLAACSEGKNDKQSDETTTALTTVRDDEVCNETSEVTSATEATETSATETSAEVTETTAVEIPDLDLASLDTFEVTSENLNDGVWDDLISDTAVGSNTSPELSWEAIDGADAYVLYMIDESAMNWIHMRVSGITENSLAAGAIDDRHYVGPYPPAGSGDHEYVVYIFAVRENPSMLRGLFDSSCPSIDRVFSALDVNEAGETGNIIAYGTVGGTFAVE